MPNLDGSPTLEEVALAQTNNPNNPWLTPVSRPVSSLSGDASQTVETRAPGAAGTGPIPYQPNPGLPNYNPNPGQSTAVAPQPPPVGGILGRDPGAKSTVARIIDEPENIRSGSGQRHPKESGEPAIITTGVGGAGSGGKPSLSPERERFNAQNEVEDKRKGILDQEVAVDKRNKDLLQFGLESAHKAGEIRDANFELDKMSNDLHKFQTEQASKERSRLLDQEAQETRAAKVDPQHWFKSKGVAGSILAAVSMAGGAFAAAMPHTNSNQNFAMKIIDDAVGRDIDAQKEDINNKWKSLNYHSSQNDKLYVREQYKLNKMEEARYKAYDHASALIQEMKTNTNDQVAISNLDKLGLGIENKKLDLENNRAERMFGVKKYEQQQAAAAANSNPYSAVNLEKDWHKYITEATAKQAENPKAPGPMSKEDWFKTRTTGGSASAGGGGGKEEKNFEEGLGTVLNGFDQIAKNNPITPGILPNSEDQRATEHRDRVNGQIIAIIHDSSKGLRSPELIHETTDKYKINRWDNDKTIKDKKEGLNKFVRSMRQMKSGTGEGGEKGVEGATPVD